MSVKIRLALTGKTHQISYRLVAQDIRSKRDGKFLEILGHFNPGENDKSRIHIDKDKVKLWLAKGATFSDSAKYLFEKGELPPRPKKERESKKATPPKQEEEQVPTEQPTQEAQAQEPTTDAVADPTPEPTTPDTTESTEPVAQTPEKVEETEQK